MDQKEGVKGAGRSAVGVGPLGAEDDSEEEEREQ